MILRIFDNPHGKYEFQEILGRGGTSVVYLARHKTMKVLRAIKEIPKSMANHNSYFVELTILSRLKIKGIPQIYDVAEDEDNWYIIEEYISGIAFRDYIESDERTVNELLQLIYEICDILTRLHEMKPRGIVYNDLKPENIIVSESGVHLLDFGNCRLLEEDNNITDSVGRDGTAKEEWDFGRISAFNVSPEHFMGETLSVLTDVYGIGVLIQEVYQSNIGKFMKVDSGVQGMKGYEQRKSSDLVNIINEAVAGCMEKSREDRFSSPNDVKQYIVNHIARLTLSNHGDTVALLCRHSDTTDLLSSDGGITDLLSNYESIAGIGVSDTAGDNGNGIGGLQGAYIGSKDIPRENVRYSNIWGDRRGRRVQSVGKVIDIYVYGSRHFAGATHFAVGYAGYLVSVGKNAMYVEHAGTNSMLSFIDKNKFGVVAEDGRYIYNKCIMCPDYSGFVREESDCLSGTELINVHDGGLLDTFDKSEKHKTEELHIQRSIMVIADIKSYGRINYEDYRKDDSVLYIANFSDMQGYRRFKRNMRTEVIRMPFFDNPFVRGREVREFYAKVSKKL